MQTKNKKAFTALVVAAVIVVASAFFLFMYHMGTNDGKALTDFTISYTQYDRAMTDFSQAVLSPDQTSGASVDDLERKTNDALVNLNVKASGRISSLTRHDGDLMKLSKEIATLAADEFDTLMAYHNTAAYETADLELLANQFQDLVIQRQKAHAHYVELLGIKQ